MVGYAQDESKLMTNAAKQGDTVFLVGKQILDESKVGGSLYQRVLYDFIGGEIDKVDSELELKLVKAIFDLRDKGLVNACNDVSEGGIFGALFECLRAGEVGFSGSLIKIKNAQKALFGEINGRYILTSSSAEGVEAYLSKNNIPYSKLGSCCGNKVEFDGYNLDLARLFDLYDNTISLEIEK
jgi:phosphoribosylformylglycinamidine synthase